MTRRLPGDGARALQAGGETVLVKAVFEVTAAEVGRLPRAEPVQGCGSSVCAAIAPRLKSGCSYSMRRSTCSGAMLPSALSETK